MIRGNIELAAIIIAVALLLSQCDVKLSHYPNHRRRLTMLNPDMPVQELRLHMGELTANEVLVARAAIRWANEALLKGLNNEKTPNTQTN